MDLEQATLLLRQTLVMALIIASPMLLTGLVVGISVSLFQTVTQIQEQTLTFIPKIVSMVAALIVLAPWLGHQLMAYAAALFATGELPVTTP